MPKISFYPNSTELKDSIEQIPYLPGIYRMINNKNEVIYVGKAKNLKKRIKSYFFNKASDIKTLKLVSQIHQVEVIVTASEYEAFILENTLIKKYKPNYNILFKDDKTYPYIVITREKFPRVYSTRNKSLINADYFGPYTSASSLKSMLSLINKIFPIRQCENSQFISRTRPCLQYQIKRCGAPCVGYVSEKTYNEQVQLLISFLKGKNNFIVNEISTKMLMASKNERFEDALLYKNQLMLLRKLQAEQTILISSDGLIEVFAIENIENHYVILVLQVLNGNVIGNRTWSVVLNDLCEKGSILDSILSHYYLSSKYRTIWPKQVIIPLKYNVNNSLLKLISYRANLKISWIKQPKMEKLKLKKLAKLNARSALESMYKSKLMIENRIKDFVSIFHIPNIEIRIECFDVSHFQGESTIASCVVLDDFRFKRSSFRRYKIKGISLGDDYAAIKQAVRRRLGSKTSVHIPDVIIIDGGRGQFKQAYNVLYDMRLHDKVLLLSLGKGPERVSGDEDIYYAINEDPLKLEPSQPAFLLLRQIRDEAHNFAIEGQRKDFARKKMASILDQVVGIGEKKKKAILTYFGGLQELKGATRSEIEKVEGVGPLLAEEIWRILKHI